MNPHDREAEIRVGPASTGSARRQGRRWAAVWPRASAGDEHVLEPDDGDRHTVSMAARQTRKW